MNLPDRVSGAVKRFWAVRTGQATRVAGADRSGRAAVTGGKQMDGFLELIAELLIESGLPEESIRYDARLELPGYYRPTKRWDLLVVQRSRLLAVIELKSQVGSFGANCKGSLGGNGPWYY